MARYKYKGIRRDIVANSYLVSSCSKSNPVLTTIYWEYLLL